ncbi:hypothetical protein BayCH28_10190 [Mycolicibacterium sp. CH28]|uniref:hypothetical protein n=1 Tax=Mycolicibacterium sp. CH28 TaxID=2512237 RepID=UPI0010817C66|nr:hypothetical protein [Mycolicibacterium sp. CH28]TGD88132.1 hypothetical protein BayCH28_10190 [Mycolicibacterium sp. CH28]
MGKHRLARPRRRWSVAVVALAALPVAAVLTASTGGRSSNLAPTEVECCAELVASGPLDFTATRVSTHYIALSQADLVASRSAVNRSALRALPVGIAPERGLQVKTILAERLISAYFPQIHSIGGVRADALKWHPMGLAIDVMIPDYQTPAGKELGDRVAAFALANSDRLSLNHVIWRRIMYSRTGKPYLMPNLGGDDANHYTHVHIATDGGGYPTGNEQYFG